MVQHLKIVIESAEPAVVRLIGEFDLLARDVVYTTLAPLCVGDGGGLTIDLGGVSFLDSAGINTFLRLHRLRPEAGLRLVNPTPIVSKSLELTGLASVIPIVADGHA
jgi:anti-anti-sigma factor